VTGYRIKDNWGLINLENHKVTKAEFIDLSPGQGSVIVARKKITNTVQIKTGCINTSGKTIIPFLYDGLRISSLRAIVFDKQGIKFKHGLIDLENKILIPLQHQVIYPLGSLRYAVVSYDNKTAIFSEEGKQLTNFLIDSISSFKKNYSVIYQNQRQGLINREGSIVLDPIFREIKINDDGTVATRKADAWLFLDGENKLTQQYNADSIEALSSDIYKISAAGKTLLANRELKPISDLLVSSIGKFQNGKALFSNSGKTGLLKKDGTILLQATYTHVINEKSFIRVRHLMGDNLRWQVLDSTGRIVSQKSYDYIGTYNGKFFPVRSKGFWGAMSSGGKEIIACVHDSILQYRNNYLVVKFKGQYGIINIKEDWIITPRANRLSLVGDNLYTEKAKPNLFLKSFQGDVIYFTQNPVEVREDHLLEFQPSGWITKINFKGVISDRFMQNEGIEKIFPESEGYRAIKRDGKYGFIDNRSRLRIANRYENVKSFSEGLAAMQILGKWGFLNKEDKIAVQPVYEEVISFKFGLAVVKQKNLFGVIDKNGKLVLPVRFEKIDVLSVNRIAFSQNGMQGLADANGQIILNPKFDSVRDTGKGYIIVERDSKFGVVTNEGISTIPLIYDNIIYDNFHNQFMAVKKAEWESVKF
jgi:hypothetical protein